MSDPGTWGWWDVSLEELVCRSLCDSEQRVPPARGWLLPGSDPE